MDLGFAGARRAARTAVFVLGSGCKREALRGGKVLDGAQVPAFRVSRGRSDRGRPGRFMAAANRLLCGLSQLRSHCRCAFDAGAPVTVLDERPLRPSVGPRVPTLAFELAVT